MKLLAIIITTLMITGYPKSGAGQNTDLFTTFTFTFLGQKVSNIFNNTTFILLAQLEATANHACTQELYPQITRLREEALLLKEEFDNNELAFFYDQPDVYLTLFDMRVRRLQTTYLSIKLSVLSNCRDTL